MKSKIQEIKNIIFLLKLFTLIDWGITIGMVITNKCNILTNIPNIIIFDILFPILLIFYFTQKLKKLTK